MTTKRMNVSFVSIGSKDAAMRNPSSVTAFTQIGIATAAAQCSRNYANTVVDYDRALPRNSTRATPAKINITASATLGVIFSPNSTAPSNSATSGLTSA